MGNNTYALEGAIYDRVLCRVTEVFSKSDPSRMIREKWYKNKMFAHATVISTLNEHVSPIGSVETSAVAKRLGASQLIDRMNNCKRVDQLNIFKLISDVLDIAAVFILALEFKPCLVEHPLKFVVLRRGCCCHDLCRKGALFKARPAKITLHRFIFFCRLDFFYFFFLGDFTLSSTCSSSCVLLPLSVGCDLVQTALPKSLLTDF